MFACTPSTIPPNSYLENTQQSAKDIKPSETRSSNSGVFSTLPTEILEYLFSFTPLPQYRRIRFVCTDWRGATGELMFANVLEKMKSATREIFHNVDLWQTPHWENFNQVMDRIFLKPTTLIDFERKEEVISALLKEIEILPSSRQNGIIDKLIEIWKKQNDKALVNDLYRSLFFNRNTSITIKLHLLAQPAIREALADRLKDMPPLEKGIIMKDTTHFYCVEVIDPIEKQLNISPMNQFDINELVAINHRGLLIEDRECLFYGVVRNIEKTESGAVLYDVFAGRSKTGFWCDNVKAVPEMLGKIPVEYSSHLPERYLPGIADNS